MKNGRLVCLEEIQQEVSCSRNTVKKHTSRNSFAAFFDQQKNLVNHENNSNPNIKQNIKSIKFENIGNNHHQTILSQLDQIQQILNYTRDSFVQSNKNTNGKESQGIPRPEILKNQYTQIETIKNSLNNLRILFNLNSKTKYGDDRSSGASTHSRSQSLSESLACEERISHLSDLSG